MFYSFLTCKIPVSYGLNFKWFSTFFFETQFLRWISNETHVESKVLTELVDLIGEELLKQGPQTVRGRLMFNEGIYCTDLLKHIYALY